MIRQNLLLTIARVNQGTTSSLKSPLYQGSWSSRNARIMRSLAPDWKSAAARGRTYKPCGGRRDYQQLCRDDRSHGRQSWLQYLSCRGWVLHIRASGLEWPSAKRGRGSCDVASESARRILHGCFDRGVAGRVPIADRVGQYLSQHTIWARSATILTGALASNLARCVEKNVRTLRMFEDVLKRRRASSSYSGMRVGDFGYHQEVRPWRHAITLGHHGLCADISFESVQVLGGLPVKTDFNNCG